MAYYNKRANKRTTSAQWGSHVPGSTDDTEDGRDFTPKVDRNPYYRTMDILNGIFKKKIWLQEGKRNSTDLKSISVNFGERRMRAITGIAGPGKAQSRTIYQLECGHIESLKNGYATDGSARGACLRCGAQQSYLGFEHEWQHIIFKSDLALRAAFVDQYVNQLLVDPANAGANKTQLTNFLHLAVNVFDDLRCNSLWERVYPGSASMIWERWERITREAEDQVNHNFLAYIFAIAFGVETDPAGKFESLRPVLEWGVQKVKYRGFAKMLLDVRLVLDRCMGLLLAQARDNQQDTQPPQLQPSPPDQGKNDGQQQGHPGGQNDAGSMDVREGLDRAEEDSQQDGEVHRGSGEGDHERDDGPDNDSDRGSADGSGASGADEEPEDSEEAGGGAIRSGVQAQTPVDAPSAAKESKEDQLQALMQLLAGAAPVDKTEEHVDMDPGEAQATLASASQAARAALAQALNMSMTDLDDAGTDQVDADMQAAIQQLQNGLALISKDSQLTAGAKAKIQLITVQPSGVDGSRVTLGEEERALVNRLRSAFIRSMGAKKAKRQAEGNVVDVQALIRHRFDRQDPDIFESDDAYKGFAYSILCDMSGSMYNVYPSVVRAVEMLKQSLDFPFVEGELWGFRGGEMGGEVWLYRYHPDCKGYTGITKHRLWSNNAGRFLDMDLPVECGGLTPMHSALHVVSTQLRTQVSSSMAKRLFLLTDGSPAHNRTGGAGLPTFLLREYVAKGIALARAHGVQVYTIVIGEHSIRDEECKDMFGNRRYWRKSSTSTVGDELAKLVLANFNKYLSSRS